MATIRVHTRHHLRKCTRLFARMVAINKLETLTKNMIKTYHLEDKMNAV